MSFVGYLWASTPGGARPTVGTVAALCGLLILFDGYDMAMYGSVTPALLSEPGWALAPWGVGAIGSGNLVGMLVGAIVAGLAADRFGRRRVLLASVAWLSAGMLVCALSPSLGLFATARSLTGLGMGALFPLVTALVREATTGSPSARHSTVLSALSLCGVFVGGVLAGLASLGLVGGPGGWRIMFGLGGAALVLLPVLARYLPESRAWLHAATPDVSPQQAAAPEAAGRSALSRTGIGVLFCADYRRVTVAAWALLFCSLLLNFGMLTWLPTVLIRSGLPQPFALASLAVVNLAAVIGGLAAGRTGDRYGPKTTVAGLFGLGAASLLGLGTATPDTGWTPVLVAVAGVGTLGTQLLSTIFVGALYPTRYRARGLGWALGVGRLGGIAAPLIGGALLGSALAPQTLFVIFAGVAVLGLTATLAVPARAVLAPAPAPDSTTAQS